MTVEEYAEPPAKRIRRVPQRLLYGAMDEEEDEPKENTINKIKLNLNLKLWKDQSKSKQEAETKVSSSDAKKKQGGYNRRKDHNSYTTKVSRNHDEQMSGTPESVPLPSRRSARQEDRLVNLAVTETHLEQLHKSASREGTPSATTAQVGGETKAKDAKLMDTALTPNSAETTPVPKPVRAPSRRSSRMARTSGASTPQNDNAGTHRLETLVATPKETSVAQEVIVAQEQVSEADSEPYDEYSLKVRKGWRTRRPPTDQKYWNPPHDSRFIKENYLQDGLCSPRLKGYHSTYHVYRNRWLPLPQKLASDEPTFMEIPKEFLLPFEAFCLFDKDCSVKPPPPYKLISENIYVGRKPQTEKLIHICSCTYVLGQASCLEGVCYNSCTFTQCDPERCPAKETCTNQIFSAVNPDKPKIEVFFAGQRGHGLRTTTPIKAGTFIAEYNGEIISTKECTRRMETIYQDKPHYYFLEYRNNEVVDAGTHGSMVRFANHSCDPNCHIEKWNVKGEHAIGLFASKDIPAYSELFYDYNFEWYTGANRQRCYCHSANCRTYIEGKKSESKDKNKNGPGSNEEDSNSSTDEGPISSERSKRKSARAKKVNPDGDIPSDSVAAESGTHLQGTIENTVVAEQEANPMPCLVSSLFSSEAQDVSRAKSPPLIPSAPISPSRLSTAASTNRSSRRLRRLPEENEEELHGSAP